MQMTDTKGQIGVQARCDSMCSGGDQCPIALFNGAHTDCNNQCMKKPGKIGTYWCGDQK